jgi:hypothetical protein
LILHLNFNEPQSPLSPNPTHFAIDNPLPVSKKIQIVTLRLTQRIFSFNFYTQENSVICISLLKNNGSSFRRLTALKAKLGIGLF